MPDIEGVPYEATGGKIDQATAQALAARHREAATAGVTAAGAAVAPVQSQVNALSAQVDSAVVDAKAYTDQKVTGLATTAAMNAADALTLSNAKAYADSKVSPLATVASVTAGDQKALADAKAYADQQVAGLDLGSGIETVSGTVTLDATGEPIREFYTTGATTFNANGHTTLISAFTAVVWKRDGSGRWAYAVVDAWKDTLPPTPDTTAPTPGVLAVSNIAATSATLTVSGAIDNQALASSPYRFSVDNGASWSTWRSSPTFTVDGLTGSTVYNALAEVKDAAGLTAQTAVKQFTTLAEPVVPFTFTGAADAPLTGLTYRGQTFEVDANPSAFVGSSAGLPTDNATPLTLTGANSAKGKGWNYIEASTGNFEASIKVDSLTKLGNADIVRIGLNFPGGGAIAAFALVNPAEQLAKFYVGGSQVGASVPINGATTGTIKLRKEGKTLTFSWKEVVVGTITLGTSTTIGSALALFNVHPSATFSDLLIQPL